MKKVFSLLIKGYQLTLSPFLGNCCRFYPSCSNYALEALEKHGLVKGLLLTSKRLCKCHPWNKGGVDLP
ncbi:MAG: membrane protein insertion efficiency factor YidD [Chlamydiota bacterium]